MYLNHLPLPPLVAPPLRLRLTLDVFEFGICKFITKYYR